MMPDEIAVRNYLFSVQLQDLACWLERHGQDTTTLRRLEIGIHEKSYNAKPVNVNATVPHPFAISFGGTCAIQE